MDIPHPNPIHHPTQSPCYPRGEGGHFQSRARYSSISNTHTHPRRAVPPASPFPSPSRIPLPPFQFGTRDFKTSTILQRQKRMNANAGGCLPTVGTTSPAPSCRAVPHEVSPSRSTSTSTPGPYPPQLPMLIPASPIIMEPPLMYPYTPPNRYPQRLTFIGPALPTQRDLRGIAPPSTQCGHDHPDRESEPVSSPSLSPPSPGPSYTSTPPASIHARDTISNPNPTPTPTPAEQIRRAVLTLQARQFMARVEAFEQAREEREEAHREEIRGREEARRKKGVRGRVRRFWGGE